MIISVSAVLPMKAKASRGGIITGFTFTRHLEGIYIHWQKCMWLCSSITCHTYATATCFVNLGWYDTNRIISVSAMLPMKANVSRGGIIIGFTFTGHLEGIHKHWPKWMCLCYSITCDAYATPTFFVILGWCDTKKIISVSAVLPMKAEASRGGIIIYTKIYVPVLLINMLHLCIPNFLCHIWVMRHK